MGIENLWPFISRYLKTRSLDSLSVNGVKPKVALDALIVLHRVLVGFPKLQFEPYNLTLIEECIKDFISRIRYLEQYMELILVFDGGVLGNYRLELCESCYDIKDKRFLIEEKEILNSK